MTIAPAPSFDGLISICIPTYKRTSFLRFCLDSCRAQYDAAIEIVVHDDTPDDSIEQIVRDYPGLPIRYIRNDPPLGLVGKLNDFLAIARGEWAVVLCEDDVILPGFLATLRHRIARHPDATTVRCRNVLIDAEGETLRTDNVSPEVSDSLDFIAQLFSPTSTTFTINLTGFAFRPALLRELGGWAQCHKAYLTDRFALLRLAGRGVAICDPAPLCGIRRHGESISSSFDSDHAGAIASVRALEAEASQALVSLSSEHNQTAIARARSAIAGFVARNLSRAMDRSYLALVAGPGAISAECRNNRAEAMRQNRIPPFGSLPVYRILARLPEPLRLPLARAFIRLKQRAQH